MGGRGRLQEDCRTVGGRTVIVKLTQAVVGRPAPVGIGKRVVLWLLGGAPALDKANRHESVGGAASLHLETRVVLLAGRLPVEVRRVVAWLATKVEQADGQTNGRIVHCQVEKARARGTLSFHHQVELGRAVLDVSGQLVGKLLNFVRQRVAWP